MRLFFFILLLYSSHLSADNLRIAVASNFYTTLNTIKTLFEEKHSVKIDLIKGSTGKLFAQIKHGAPYDIFLAADTRRPERLEKSGFAENNSRYTYAIGQLAFWSKNYSKIAIANPKTAPYGYAALETLTRLDLYKNIKSKLVYGENISQTFQFVESGSAEYGFIALSQIINKSSDYSIVPIALYSPIEQQLVLLKSSKNKNLAKKFIHFMQQDSTKKLIISQGYYVYSH